MQTKQLKAVYQPNQLPVNQHAQELLQEGPVQELQAVFALMQWANQNSLVRLEVGRPEILESQLNQLINSRNQADSLEYLLENLDLPQFLAENDPTRAAQLLWESLHNQQTQMQPDYQE
jgi:hypothetical protein